MQNLSLHWRNWTASRKYARSRVIEQPLRGELFGVEQLARLARALATSHQVVTQHTPDRLLSRLSANEQCLRAFNRSTLAINSTRRITPAADWVLDNFYLIEEQIQMARRHLPRGYATAFHGLSVDQSGGLAVAGACPKNCGKRICRRSGHGDIADAFRERRERDARLYKSHSTDTGSSSFIQWSLPCCHQQLRRWVQSLAGSGGHPLARGCHARCLRHLCLPARSNHRGFVVGGASAHFVPDPGL